MAATLFVRLGVLPGIGLSSRRSSSSAIKTVAVLGCGQMGSGIAQVSAQSGYNVVVVDKSDQVMQDSMKRIKQSLDRVAKKKFADNTQAGHEFVQTTIARISSTTSVENASKEADLVIEAVVENMELKHQLLRVADASAPASTIFATNTSSLSVAEISSATKRPDRFGGLHFFNPVPVMALVEVVSTTQTSSPTSQALYDFAKSLGKTPIVCKDTPGFIVNRLLVPFLAEACRLYERGDCTKEDVDTGMKLGAGHPMGPLELADYVGLDVSLFILEGWAAKFPNEPLFKVPDLIRKLVSEGKLGRKSGEGFYKYK